MAFKYAIALTGGIATGKSTVAGIFESLGFVVIDADRIAHKVLDEEHEVIASRFGKRYVKDKKVKRKKLGKLVFADSHKRKELGALLHPIIYKHIEKISKQEDKKKKPYFVDIPLFFESERYPISKTLVVYVSEKQQLKRLMLRNGYTKKEAKQRIQSQIDIEKKRLLATYVIDNTKGLDALKKECKRMKKRIIGDFE